jgi:hypothetical protein
MQGIFSVADEREEILWCGQRKGPTIEKDVVGQGFVLVLSLSDLDRTRCDVRNMASGSMCL